MYRVTYKRTRYNTETHRADKTANKEEPDALKGARPVHGQPSVDTI